MTNYQAIKAMNEGQIADLLIAVDNKEIEYNHMNCNDCVSYCKPDCNECWKWWLTQDAKQPHGVLYEEERYANN